nr:reverse transcriptase domain-containing protein [Tanacetum cinerariifolium]
LSIDRCTNHNMLLVTQIDAFYNGLTLSHRDTINVAAGGTFMHKTPEECYELIENKTAHHNHWDTSTIRDETSRNISSTSTSESPEIYGGPHYFTEYPAVGGYTQETAYATTGNYNSGEKLSLPELTSTQMILEIVDRSTTRLAGIAEDVFVKVGKFHFPTDFVVVDYVVDPRVPLILGRHFLRTGRALIDVYGEEVTLRVDHEAITFKVGQTSKYSYSDAE